MLAGACVLNSLEINSPDSTRVRNFLASIRLRDYAAGKKNRRIPDSKKEYSVFGRPLEHIPRQFKKCVGEFTSYLADTSRKSFRITSQYGQDIKENTVGYIHRWTPIYRQSILAKLYQLEAALTQDELKDVTMITLTTSQRGKDQEECLLKLLKSYNLLFKLLRYYIGTKDYFYILEPHKTGYAHMHIMYMKLLTEDEKQKIISLWEDRYGAGSHKGVDFAEPLPSRDGRCGSGSISHVRSYLMKYLAKGMFSSSMTKGELLFNSLLKKNNVRLWGCSRHFSELMKRPEKPETLDYECLKVELYQDDEFMSQVYPRSKLPEIKPALFNSEINPIPVSFSPSAFPSRIRHDLGERPYHFN